MESLIILFLTIFSSPFLTTLFVIACGIGLLWWCANHFFDKRKVHILMLETAFERGMLNEKQNTY